MPLTFRAAASVAVLCATSCVALAVQAEPGARPLTRSEGASLVRHALDHRVRGRKPDCSHLLHDVLSTAGFEYPYATSTEIFAGIPQFRRVRHAQPGDVIVWPGHVGLVVDADERTFYSSTRSGLTVDEYSNKYWRRRGTPRFYRYIVTSETEPTLRASSKEPAIDLSEPSSSVDVSANYDVPGSIQIGTNRTPSKADVEEAVSELSNAAAPVLEADRDISLLLVRDLKVKKVRTTGDSGWAEIQARSAIELEPGGTWRKVKVPNQRWELRRGEDGWSVFLPDGRVFVAQSAAIPILARRLPTGSVGSARAAEADGMRALVTLLRKENPQRER